MTIQVVVTTYVPREKPARAEYLRHALMGLRDNLKAPEDESIEFILANDGPVNQPSVVGTGYNILEWHKREWHAVGGARAGIGGSLNRALAEVKDGDIWMYTTDDWVLTKEYDLTQSVRLIREINYDYVRLGPPHPNIMCQTMFQQGLGWWLNLHPECGGFAFATRPFLASRRFYNLVGEFEECCDAYVCERDYADRAQALSDILRLAEVVSDSLEGPWKHIGEVSVGETYP